MVAKDEFDDKGLRIILNYGHTVGHAIEAASSYSGRYDHGEAVAVGMVTAAEIARKLRMVTDEGLQRIVSLVGNCGLPLRVKGLSFAKIYRALAHDKKFARGKNRFVLPAGIGRAKVIEDIPERLIKEAIIRHVA